VSIRRRSVSRHQIRIHADNVRNKDWIILEAINERRPWYEPSEQLPDQPVISTPAREFESLVVEMPAPRASIAS